MQLYCLDKQQQQHMSKLFINTTGVALDKIALFLCVLYISCLLLQICPYFIKVNLYLRIK